MGGGVLKYKFTQGTDFPKAGFVYHSDGSMSKAIKRQHYPIESLIPFLSP